MSSIYSVHIIPLADVCFCVCVLFLIDLPLTRYAEPAELVFLYDYSFQSVSSPLCSLKGHLSQVRFCVHSFLPAYTYVRAYYMQCPLPLCPSSWVPTVEVFWWFSPMTPFFSYCALFFSFRCGSAEHLLLLSVHWCMQCYLFLVHLSETE